MEQTDDQYYINQVKNGDPASYAFLVNKYKDMVYSIAIKILRNPEDAQDLAQECFLKAYQQVHRFEGKSKFSTWLYTIVYRAAVTRLKENRLVTTTMEDSLDEIPDHAAGQFEQLQASQVRHYVKAAIGRLAPIESLVVSLYYMDELPVKEIQEITGLSLPNIKILLFRARKKLERKLKFLLDHEK